VTSVTFERACVCVCVCVCGFRHLFERRSVCVAFVAVAGRRGRPALKLVVGWWQAVRQAGWRRSRGRGCGAEQFACTCEVTACCVAFTSPGCRWIHELFRYFLVLAFRALLAGALAWPTFAPASCRPRQERCRPTTTGGAGTVYRVHGGSGTRLSRCLRRQSLLFL
jgi:hypothetical protein